MKYSVFALLALSLFLFADCQNTPAGSGDTATGSAPSSLSVDPPPPAPDLKSLNAQVMTDLIGGRTLLRKYDSTFQQASGLIREMKHTYRIVPDPEKESISKIHESLFPFLDAYIKQRAATDQLDSLTAHIMNNSVKLEDAQKEYISARATMITEGQKLTAAKVDLESCKSQFETIFAKANKAAEGH